MPFLLLLLIIYLVAVLLVLPIWTLHQFRQLHRGQDELRRQLEILERTVRKTSITKPEPFETRAAASPTATPPVPREPTSGFPIARSVPQMPEPPPFPTISDPPEQPLDESPFVEEPEPPDELPPVPIFRTSAPAPPRPAQHPSFAQGLESIDWEQFMGAKLFAWLGGFALFLALAFFVKYSFEHDLIPPAMRVAIGFVLGGGLVVGGLMMPRKKYAITAQTLVAAGIVSLYAVTFSCRSIYHFEFFGPVPTFLLMSLITTTAFVLAVRLEAQVVAILGMLGGFLTPVLISTGVDNPGGLFGYIAVLDVGLVAVALHRRWFHLVPLGGVGTIFTIVGWAATFYIPEKYLIAMAVCLGFCLLFQAATEVGRRRQRHSLMLAWTAIVISAVAFGFAWNFLGSPTVAAKTWQVFGYVILVSAGVFFLAFREKWEHLIAATAAVNILLIVRWVDQAWQPGLAPAVVTVCLIFCAMYFLIHRLACGWRSALGAAVAMPGVALAFALFLMQQQPVGASPALLFLFILASDLFLLAVAWCDARAGKLHLFAGLAVFGLLSLWTIRHLTDALLPWALAIYLVFAALHTVFPLVLQRKRPLATPTWWSQLFPPLALVLMLLPIFRLENISFLLWPAILLVDLIAVGLAVVSATLLSVAGVLMLSLFAAGLSLLRLPASSPLEGSFLIVVGGFAVFFFAVTLWLARRLGKTLTEANRQAALPGWNLPAFASLLPFLLLIMACTRLAIPDPSALFGLGLLLVAMTLGLTNILLASDKSGSGGTSGTSGTAWLPACAMVGVAALEWVWHTQHFSSEAAVIPLAWYLGFYVVFAVHPFLFRQLLIPVTGPWAVAALSGPIHFWMVYQSVKTGWPQTQGFLGAVPALFALPPLLSLVVILRTDPAENSKRLDQLAWFGGVALLFITLIFPIQWERQWLTVAWALEGVALVWLFHRVPHPALRATGITLLVIAFVRLALNPAVLDYHVRGNVGILNWFLYAYGITIVALFLAARLLAPPRERVFGINAQPLLNALGVVLAFLLLNLEIADFFTAPGAFVSPFSTSDNFARDMSYTIGWALFALGLLGAGIRFQTKPARYAAIVLLSVALLKLFLHDLASLEALYRIGALFAVAVIAMLASFAYQRFLPNNDKSP